MLSNIFPSNTFHKFLACLTCSGVVKSVNNHLIQYRHAHFQDLGLDTNQTSLKYIYIYLLSHCFLHILRFPLIEFVTLTGLVRIPLSWRTGGWWPLFTWVFFSHHASTTANWFSFNCTQQVPVLVYVLWKQITMNLVQFTVQFEQQTKSPVASNSSAVKQVTHFKWNLCLHLLHLTLGVWSVSKYTNKWFAMSLNCNSNKIPAFALIRQIAQVHLYLQPGKSWARSSKSGKSKFICKTDTHTHTTLYLVQFSHRSTPAVRSAFTVIFNNFYSWSSVNSPWERSMYTMVWLGNILLNSGSLWEHPQILQILRFRRRSNLVLSLTISSVCTQFKA